MTRLVRRQTEDEYMTALRARGWRQRPLERWLRRVKRVLLAALAVAGIAVIAAVLHAPPAAPAPATTVPASHQPTTTGLPAGSVRPAPGPVRWAPTPAGPPATDAAGRWTTGTAPTGPDSSSSPGGGR